ncbi:YafY family transcriptional regulator [Paenibacillus sp. MWE-103]|uniref:YafY family transcriptional regulator n=1 Tax=Paenibacillus artemisiicola TaxID=1172618 RepID=A0ABS3WCX0_9BACL|nr:YafY family protein [Paenibacillus artemisiicola]MBO7746127.1 YafY family transcriptional regulator [Paenibacillus artemisiicola]
MSKADNMLAILMLLRARRRMTARQLAEELEVHRRTVYRCIDGLCAAGVPVVSETGRDGGYYLTEAFKLEPLFFDPEEQKALLHAIQFAKRSGYPYEEAMERAVGKIKRSADAGQAERLERQRGYVDVVQGPADAALAGLLELLETAIDGSRSLEMAYATGRYGELTQRRFDPYGLARWKGKWYAAGYCHLRGELRSFRVDRIRGLELADGAFARPEGFSAGAFLLDGLLPPEAGDAAADGGVTVRVAGTQQALDELCAHWLFGRALAERTERTAAFRLDEESLYAAAPHYLLSLGGQIRVEAPAELRRCLRELAEALLHQYADEPAG